MGFCDLHVKYCQRSSDRLCVDGELDRPEVTVEAIGKALRLSELSDVRLHLGDSISDAGGFQSKNSEHLISDFQDSSSSVGTELYLMPASSAALVA